MDRPGRPGRGRLTVPPASPLAGALLPRCAFPPPGTPVVAAVSGGADSLALLALAVASGAVVTAVHVDHGRRVGSAGEAGLVADVAHRFGAGFRAERVVVAPGPNLEARARDARYAVLPAGVLTGHTADDRAETVLLHLLRGAGPTGLAGIRRGPRRPILDLRRHETEALCAELGLEPLQDPSNDDPVHRRNRVRHELLPLVAEIGDRDPVPLLVRQADLFGELDDAIDELAATIDCTSAPELRAAPRPLAGAAIRRWLQAAGVGDGHPADAAMVDRVRAVAANQAVACDLVGGWRVARTAGRLRLVAPPS
ncbi:tRNA lysidine(34) synthetase TilS [soil metagenome]